MTIDETIQRVINGPVDTMRSLEEKIVNALRSRGLITDMPILLLVRLPLAPSTNELTADAPVNGRRIKSRGAKTWHQKAFSIIKERYQSFAFNAFKADHTHYRLTLLHTFNTDQSFIQSDSDNRIKQCQDTIAKAMEFNDNMVLDVRSIRIGVAQWKGASTVAILQPVNVTAHDEELIHLLEMCL